jgi:hypothetical protein
VPGLEAAALLDVTPMRSATPAGRLGLQVGIFMRRSSSRL